MTKTTRRPNDGNGHTPDTPAPAKCPYVRHLSYRTCEYSIDVGFDDLTELMDETVALLEHVENWVDDEGRDMFDALIVRIARMRKWTGAL